MDQIKNGPNKKMDQIKNGPKWTSNGRRTLVRPNLCHCVWLFWASVNIRQHQSISVNISQHQPTSTSNNQQQPALMSINLHSIQRNIYCINDQNINGLSENSVISDVLAHHNYKSSCRLFELTNWSTFSSSPNFTARECVKNQNRSPFVIKIYQCNL